MWISLALTARRPIARCCRRGNDILALNLRRVMTIRQLRCRCLTTQHVVSDHNSTALESLLEIALDLTASLAAADRYGAAARGRPPVDSLRCGVPASAGGRRTSCRWRASGCRTRALARRYDRREHPRLDVILRSREAGALPADSLLADPFDGEIDSGDAAVAHDHVHACLGCPLTEGGEVVGALTADALEPHRFDALDEPCSRCSARSPARRCARRR